MLAVASGLTFTHLCTIRLDIVEEEHHNGEEEPAEKIKATPPSTRHLDSLGQHISQWLGKLKGIQQLWFTRNVTI